MRLGTSLSDLKEYSLMEVREHSIASDCWIVIYDHVYDVTSFLSEHPGGEYIILEWAGRDATLAFRGTRHGKDSYESLSKYLIGVLPESERIYSDNEIPRSLINRSSGLERPWSRIVDTTEKTFTTEFVTSAFTSWLSAALFPVRTPVS